MKLDLPAQVTFALDRLTLAGHEAYVVGGCVRDLLRDKLPHDWDVTTSATPDQMKQVFADQRLLETGLRHGTLTLLRQGLPVEITTYRVDGVYSDGRRPDQVRFTSRLEEDLARRDFTINAMAYHPARGLVDRFGGQQDLARELIRCVGDAHRRFAEDALRILRALRFASVLGFEIEESTAAALFDCKDLLTHISPERIFSEFTGLLCGNSVAPVLLAYPQVLGVVVPEILPTVGFDQHSPYHCYDIWEHTARSVAAILPQPVLRLTMLFHDLGKPETFSLEDGVGHFYSHPTHSRQLAHDCLLRLRCDNETRAAVDCLVRYHDTPLPTDRRLMRRWLTRLGEPRMRELLLVHRADNAAQAPCCDHTPLWDQVELLLDTVLAEGDCFSLASLAVDGRDMMALGLTGPAIGRTLRLLLEAVVDERLPNEREQLLSAARALEDSPAPGEA